MGNEKCGIDITGRKMWYEPWTTDSQGRYLPPDEKEIEDTYGASGEAFQETLLYFEECGGDSRQLILLLNDHVPDKRFIIDRENLLNETRWYTQEYYFYFIMFTKKIMKDYDWHFTKGENILLSEYHKIFEQGFLRYMPYGEGIKETSNIIPYSFIKYFSSIGYDFSDLFHWVDILTKEKTPISYKDDVSKLDNYWICDEFLGYLDNFTRVIINKNNIMEMVHEGFDTYHLGGLAYVPESMLLKILPHFIYKSSVYYKVEVNRSRSNSVSVILKDAKVAKAGIYLRSTCKKGNSLVMSAMREVLKKLMKLDNLPEIRDVTGLYSDYCSFTLKWEKRIPAVPCFKLMICTISAFILFLFNFLHHWLGLPAIVLGYILTSGILMLLQRLKQETYKKELAENHVIKISEDDNKRLEKAEELSGELMREKEELERKVMERTAKLAEANEHLKELDAAKTGFFANISHELRTPLTLILGPLDSILNKHYGSAIAYNDEKLAMMMHNGSKLLKLINDLLDFTKIESGKMKIRNQRTDITGLLRFYISIIRTYASDKKVYVVFNDNTIHPHKKNGRVITCIDKALLDKAVFNLLSNALKFTREGGSIILQLDRKENDFSISVKDTGIGIPADKLSFVFDRFSQVDGSSSRHYGGTGIGLSLTKEIIELLGGKIEVISKLGEGSIFTITLPIRETEDTNQDEDDKAERIHTLKTGFSDDFQTDRRNFLKSHTENNAAKDNRADNVNKKKILIVEDSIDMQKYLASVLGDNYNLVVSNNGAEGLEKAKITKPDLILADVMMPEMDGYTMTGLIKSDKSLRGVPVIMLTAKADIFMKLEGFEKGADDYIIKPFSAKELKARIKSHLLAKEMTDRIIRQRDEILAQKNSLEKAIIEKNTAYTLLTESEARYHALIEDLPAGVVEFDRNTYITYINPAGRELFQLGEKDTAKRLKITDFIRPASVERFNAEMKDIEESHKAKMIEFQFFNKDDGDFMVLLKAVPIFQGSKTAGIRAIIIEIKTHLNIAFLPDESFYQKYRISRREKEVFLNLIKGFKNKDICDNLYISERTVKMHITNILQKTGCGNRSELFGLVRTEMNR